MFNFFIFPLGSFVKNLQIYFSCRVYSFLYCLFTVSLPLFFVSCSFFMSDEKRGSYQNDNVNNANFIVEEVKGRVVPTRVNGLPEEIQIFYKTCFRDFIHPDNTLQNSLFKIYFFENFGLEKKGEKKGYSEGKASLNGSTSGKKTPSVDGKCFESSSFLLSSKKSCIQIRTDSSGCLNWTEVYPYHPVDQSVWFRYGRAFEGTGVNKGVAVIPMAVNPWLSLDPSGSAIELQLMDLRYNSIDQKKKLISLQEQDVSQCRLCSSNGKKGVDCSLCRQKKRSLSSVISHFDRKAGRPRLWLNNLNANISQEHILIEEYHSEEHLKALKQFKVCHGDVKENCDPPGRFFKVRLQMPLRIRVRNYRNEPELLPLNRGSYSVKAYLFLKNEKGRYILLHRDMGFVSASLTMGSKERELTSEFHFHVPYEHYGLPAFFGLKVQAEGDFKNFFLPFEGVFSFPGQLRVVLGSNNLQLEPAIKSFYEKSISNNLSLVDSYQLSGSWLNREEEGFRRAGWDVKLNRFRFSDISVEENECPTPVDHTVRYVGEVCIVDPLTNDPVPSTRITIQRQNVFFSRDGQSREGEIVNIPEVRKSGGFDLSGFKEGQWQGLDGKPLKNLPYISDTRGCLQWMDKIYHKWYDREHYFIRKMIFSKKEWGFEGEKMIAISPWHWGFVFFQDITKLGGDSIRTAHRAKRADRPQFVLHDFRSLFPDLIYTIDRWLGINIFQNLMFLFKIRVDRPDNIVTGAGGQRPSAMDARRGYYFLRFILVKSHTEETGGRGNQVVNNESFKRQYNTVQNWNTNTGWKVGRNGLRIGQMMNTNLEYITHFDTYVQVRDSVVNAYANFIFDLHQFIFIGSNSRVIVQLLPTDPKNYVYHPDSCKVDPSRSSFVPFTDHELIARPFMGTFVAGDLRNWNIFRVLNEYTNLKIPNKDSNDDIVQLNMDPGQVDQFIKMGKQFSEKVDENGKRVISDHEFFTKLQSTFIVKTGNWSEKSLAMIKRMGAVLERLYRDMNRFLETKSDDSKLSDFEEQKNRLIESIHKTVTFATTALNGSSSDNREKEFFITLIDNLRDSLFFLESSDLSNRDLKKALQETKKNFVNLASKSLSISLSASHLQQELNHNESKKSRWFKSDMSFPDDPADWSAFNMDLFAKDEGLKVITMDDDVLVNRFLDDLNTVTRNYNKYHFSYTQNKERQKIIQESRYGRLDRELLNEEIQQVEEKHEELNKEAHEGIMNEIQKYSQAFWDNFKLIDGDDYFAVDEKTKQMYLPDINKSWLNTIVTEGIHPGTLEKPEVMTFFHSLCGFWFDKFYQDYLEQRQLDIIYLKHMDHFQYYKGTLEYFLKEKNAVAQYQDLYKAMQQYNLLPMEKSLLTVGNPFLVHKKEEPSALWNNVFSSEEVETGSDTVVQSIYKSKKHVWKEALKIHGLAVGAGAISHEPLYSILRAYRHPYFKCIANPFNFFHIEKKVIVGDIGSDYSDLTYEYGQTRNFNIQRAFDYSYSAAWTMSRSFSTSLGAGFTALGLSGGAGVMEIILSPLKAVSPFLSFGGFRLNSDWSTSRSESDQNRRQQSIRFLDEALYLNINHSAISIRLKRFRHCLVVRAQNLAFDGYKKDMVWRKDLEENFIHQIPYIKSGLMLCSEDIDEREMKEPFYITEDYFYIYQPTAGDRGQFHNVLNFRNRPYVLSVRGATELEKFTFLTHSFVEADKVKGVEDYDPYGLLTNPYNRVSKPADGFRKVVRQAKVWNKTGFYPGVYNVRYDEEHYFFRDPDIKEKGKFEQFGEWLYKNNPLGYIKLDNTNAIFQREKRQ